MPISDPLIDALTSALLGEPKSELPAIPTADDLDPFSGNAPVQSVQSAPKPAAALPPRPREIPGKEKWRRPNAPRITLEQCVNGTGPMIKMLPGEIAGKSSGNVQQNKVDKSGKTKSSPSVITFGKYRNRAIVDIVESDPQYISWCIREDVQGMREKCEKLGITEEDLS